jgi:MacB-like protein
LERCRAADMSAAFESICESTSHKETISTGGYYGDREIWIPEHPAGAPGEHNFVAYRTADPGYFSAMGIPLLRGRFFSDDELKEHDKFVIVNQELVRRYFPGEDPPWKASARAMAHATRRKLRNNRRGCEH